MLEKSCHETIFKFKFPRAKPNPPAAHIEPSLCYWTEHLLHLAEKTTTNKA
jgi:hypothetical protein